MTWRDASLAKPRDPRDPQSLRRCPSVLDCPLCFPTTPTPDDQNRYPRSTSPDRSRIPRTSNASSPRRPRREAGGKTHPIPSRRSSPVRCRSTACRAHPPRCGMRRSPHQSPHNNYFPSTSARACRAPRKSVHTPPTVSTPVSPLRGTEKATRRPSPPPRSRRTKPIQGGTRALRMSFSPNTSRGRRRTPRRRRGRRTTTRRREAARRSRPRPNPLESEDYQYRQEGSCSSGYCSTPTRAYRTRLGPNTTRRLRSSPRTRNSGPDNCRRFSRARRCDPTRGRAR